MPSILLSQPFSPNTLGHPHSLSIGLGLGASTISHPRLLSPESPRPRSVSANALRPPSAPLTFGPFGRGRTPLTPLRATFASAALNGNGLDPVLSSSNYNPLKRARLITPESPTFGPGPDLDLALARDGNGTLQSPSQSQSRRVKRIRASPSSPAALSFNTAPLIQGGAAGVQAETKETAVLFAHAQPLTTLAPAVAVAVTAISDGTAAAEATFPGPGFQRSLASPALRLRRARGMSNSTAPGRRCRVALSLDTSFMVYPEARSFARKDIMAGASAGEDAYVATVNASTGFAMATATSGTALHSATQHNMPAASSPTSLSASSARSSPRAPNFALPGVSPSPSRQLSSTRGTSPPKLSLPSSMSLKRANPKRLSLRLAIPPTPIHHSPPSDALDTCAASATDSVPSLRSAETGATPFTPGPPRTPALAMGAGAPMSMSLGRSAGRRPGLLSLITQPPTGHDVPPTPGGLGASPFASMRHVRRRSNTAEEAGSLPSVEGRVGSLSAYPRTGAGAGLAGHFAPIDEDEAASAPGRAYRHAPPTHSRSGSETTFISDSSSASGSRSGASTPPASLRIHAHAQRSSVPYGDGPIELIPGVYLGAEESVFQWRRWARSKRVRVLNVAQEVDDPFASAGMRGDVKGKGKVVEYAAAADEERPEVAYCHLRWGHGEAGLAEVDASMRLEQIVRGEMGGEEEMEERWRFWEAIHWVEEGRRKGEAVLIHCQCGVSRSATFAIAYMMALAAAGVEPALLGHLRGMQDTYDFVKAKSCWIGPNVSLVFQLVEFARNLTTLISAHLAAHPDARLETSFPTASQAQQSEADWAAQRAAFEAEGQALDDGAEDEGGLLMQGMSLVSGSGAGTAMGMGMKGEDVRREAEELDEAMRVRRLGRV